MNLTKFWRILLISLASVLFLALVGGGVYVYIKDPFGYKVPKLDKYTDILNWCEYSTEEDTLNFDCKALLLDITVDESNNSCLDMLVITKEKELKELSVCEKEDTLSYTNEVLGYKKLMPLNISFKYSKEGILNSYIFSNVSFEPMDEEYIHSIVNEDIASLVQTDMESVTTIKNSVNFCPRPEQLPEYVTEENIKLYTDFYNTNIAEDFWFSSGSLYDLGDDNLQLFLGRYSQMLSGTEINSDVSEIILTNNILQELQSTPTFTQLSSEVNKEDIFLLKTLTILYDNIPDMKFSNNSDALFSILKTLNSTESLSYTSLCSTMILLQELSDNNPAISNYISTLEENFFTKKDIIANPLCHDVTTSNYFDETGNNILIYYRLISENNNFKILNNCMNLYDLFK